MKKLHHMMQKEFCRLYFLLQLQVHRVQLPPPPSPTSVANSAPETSTPCVGFEPTDQVV